MRIFLIVLLINITGHVIVKIVVVVVVQKTVVFFVEIVRRSPMWLFITIRLLYFVGAKHKILRHYVVLAFDDVSV